MSAYYDTSVLVHKTLPWVPLQLPHYLLPNTQYLLDHGGRSQHIRVFQLRGLSLMESLLHAGGKGCTPTACMTRTLGGQMQMEGSGALFVLKPQDRKEAGSCHDPAVWKTSFFL